MKRSVSIFACAISLGAFAACSGDGLLSFTGEAIEAIPQVAASTPGALTVAVGNIRDEAYFQVGDFFRQECHMPGQVNYCPPGVDVKADGGYNAYKLTTTTLIGLIYHAEMYIGNEYRDDGSYKDCDAASAHEASVTASSFVGSGVDPDRYIIDFFDLLGCVGSPEYGGSKNSVAYSKSKDDKYYAAINTRKRVPFDGDSSMLQTDIFQTYLAMADGAPSFLAFNQVGVSSMFGRAILLSNLTDHKFAVKFQTGADSYVIAIGTGGIDLKTGVPVAGFYRVRFADSMNGVADRTICVNNADGSVYDDPADCDSAGVPWGATWSASAVQTFLGTAAADAARVANFLSFFGDTEQLSAGQYPTSAADVDAHFPDKIK